MSSCCIFPDPLPIALLPSQDGTVIVHTVRRGQYLRTLRPPGDSSVRAPISALQVGMEGHIVVQTSQEERSHRKVRKEKYSLPIEPFHNLQL